jgi:hypothetical protein
MTAETSATDERLLTWENRVRLLINPTVWPSVLLVVGTPAVLLGLFFAFLARRMAYLVMVPLGILTAVYTLFVLVALAIDAVGGMRATFILTTRGVRFVPGKSATTSRGTFMPWNEVTTIRVKASRHYVHLRGGWGDKPVGLYCTPENFREVLDVLRTHVGDRMPRASSAGH